MLRSEKWVVCFLSRVLYLFSVSLMLPFGEFVGFRAALNGKPVRSPNHCLKNVLVLGVKFTHFNCVQPMFHSEYWVKKTWVAILRRQYFLGVNLDITKGMFSVRVISKITLLISLLIKDSWNDVGQNLNHQCQHRTDDESSGGRRMLKKLNWFLNRWHGVQGQNLLWAFRKTPQYSVQKVGGASFRPWPNELRCRRRGRNPPPPPCH